STCLLTPIGFLLLIAISLRLQTSTGSSMLKSILLLMSSCFPTLEVMSIYLQILIDFSLLIVISLRLLTSIDSSMLKLILPLMSICFPTL
ncbi:TPA: hypothetical protein R1951_002542, partial [Staphylococcus delphini]|nr:hypothetical protein [Staphylococcus delphini]